MIIFFVLPAAVAAALQVLWIRMMQNPAYCYNEDSIHYCYNEDSIQNRIAYFFLTISVVGVRTVFPDKNKIGKLTVYKRLQITPTP